MDDEQKIRYYTPMLYKVGMLYLGNRQDTEDCMQDAFCKLLYNAPVVTGAEHEKAWLLRVMINRCKNELRLFWKRNRTEFNELTCIAASQTDADLLLDVFRLPVKLKDVVYLHYYSGYTVRELARYLGISESAVKMRLSRAREMLKWEDVNRNG